MFVSNTFPGDTGLARPEYKHLRFEMGLLILLSEKQSVSMTKGSFHFFLAQVIIFSSLCALIQSQLGECKNFIL